MECGEKNYPSPNQRLNNVAKPKQSSILKQECSVIYLPATPTQKDKKIILPFLGEGRQSNRLIPSCPDLLLEITTINPQLSQTQTPENRRLTTPLVVEIRGTKATTTKEKTANCPNSWFTVKTLSVILINPH
jgi:hypothetical protein